MKRLFTLMLLLCAIAPCAPAAQWQYENAVVSLPDSRSWLNMRTAPTTDSEVVALFFNGAVLSVYSEPVNGWVHVRSQYHEGYMNIEFLDLVDGNHTVTPGMPILTLNKDVRFANGRTYEKGTRVLVHGITGDSKTCEVTTGWGHHLVPLADLTPTLSLADRDEDMLYTGYVPPYAEGKTIGIVHNPSEGSRLHLRKGKSTSAASLGKYYSGTVIEILADEGDWLHVRIGALEGYMKNENVFTDESMWYYGDALQLPTARVNNRTGLNLRAGQSTSSKKLSMYDYGTEVTVLGISTSWAHVLIDGQDGFMLLDKLSPRFVF